MHPPPDLNALDLPSLYRTLDAAGLTRRLFELMRDEDLGADMQRRDATTLACFPLEQGPPDAPRLAAAVVAREPCRVAGLASIPGLARAFGLAVDCRTVAADGDDAEAGATLAEIEGPAHDVLRLERSLLNLLSRLSGVATHTARFADAIRRDAPDAHARLLDTRKTTPGLRVLEKYAVRCGGGLCHRVGLHDAVLIKDNHLAGLAPDRLGSFVESAARRARDMDGIRFVEVEVDHLAQLEALLALEPGLVDFVLLDNMPEPTLRDAVAMRDRARSPILLEASGGVTLQTVAAIARTGVDRISAGALTHAAPSVDLALEADHASTPRH